MTRQAVHGLDTEWLLSTLFDASLLSTFKAAGPPAALFAHWRSMDDARHVLKKAFAASFEARFFVAASCKRAISE